MNCVMRKPAFCICENKGADQQHSKCAADQCVLFRYTDSTIPLLPEPKISSLSPTSVALQTGLCQTWSENTKTNFLASRLILRFFGGILKIIPKLSHMSRVMRKHSGFRPGPTQTRLYSYRRWLEARNFGFRKKRDCTICVAKTKAPISFAVTTKLICVCFPICKMLVFS